MTFEDNTAALNAIRGAISQVIVGQTDVIDQVLIAFLAKGHVLLEGVPGLGKTLLVRALAQTFAGLYNRIQFTPDLMPADITGHVLYNMKEGQFTIRKGPVFANLLLADEINRAPAKTQAALLEVMQEHTVTIESKQMPVPLPFMVLATQNPIEQEGTYPLPEAELDRFIMKVVMSYPTEGEEIEILKRYNQQTENTVLDGLQAFLTDEHLLALQQAASDVHIDEQLFGYATALVRQTRTDPKLIVGGGPRASLAIVRCAKARALLNGRNHAIPDDIQQVTLPVLRHRIVPSTESELEGFTADQLIQAIIQSVAVPRQ